MPFSCNFFRIFFGRLDDAFRCIPEKEAGGVSNAIDSEPIESGMGAGANALRGGGQAAGWLIRRIHLRSDVGYWPARGTREADRSFTWTPSSPRFPSTGLGPEQSRSWIAGTELNQPYASLGRDWLGPHKILTEQYLIVQGTVARLWTSLDTLTLQFGKIANLNNGQARPHILDNRVVGCGKDQHRPRLVLSPASVRVSSNFS